jgi:hypothetical protein
MLRDGAKTITARMGFHGCNLGKIRGIVVGVVRDTFNTHRKGAKALSSYTLRSDDI